jgi:hypothetical protein
VLANYQSIFDGILDVEESQAEGVIIPSSEIDKLISSILNKAELPQQWKKSITAPS